jgi:hypothetical protein
VVNGFAATLGDIVFTEFIIIVLLYEKSEGWTFIKGLFCKPIPSFRRRHSLVSAGRFPIGGRYADWLRGIFREARREASVLGYFI